MSVSRAAQTFSKLPPHFLMLIFSLFARAHFGFVLAQYSSFNKAKVVRDKFTGKSKGFGFVSFQDPFDCAKCLREMNGKYVGNRPVKLTKSNWQDREITEVRKKEKKDKKGKQAMGLA